MTDKKDMLIFEIVDIGVAELKYFLAQYNKTKKAEDLNRFNNALSYIKQKRNDDGKST